MPIAYNEINEKSNGGTELQIRRLEKIIPKELLDKVQIIPSRLRELDTTKHRLFYCHDLPGDPESDHLKNNGWDKFHRIIFVSHWQKQQYQNYFGIPASKCVVIQNAIDPIDCDFNKFKSPETIKIIYHSTPHRGLKLLVPVFKKLKEEYSNIELNVYSSFNLYGWAERDKEYQELFDQIKSSDGMNYHGTVSNEDVRNAVSQSHIFAYPSIWSESSCLCLMEAMSAGCICVHSDFAALPETASNWTAMYSYNENIDTHATTFYHMMKPAIEMINNNKEDMIVNKLRGQKSYTDLFYSWDLRKYQWINLISAILSEPLELQDTSTFKYEVNI